MLLVHGDEAEPGERDPFLDQRVRADGDVDLARFDPLVQLRPLLLPEAARDQGDAQRPVEVRNLALSRWRTVRGGAEELAEGAEVLLGQDLRRRHHHGLLPAGDGGQQAGCGDDGLAAADVALEEAAHGDVLRQIVEELAQRLLLRAGQRERERFEEAVSQLAGQGERLGGAGLLPLPPAQQHRDL